MKLNSGIDLSARSRGAIKLLFIIVALSFFLYQAADQPTRKLDHAWLLYVIVGLLVNQLGNHVVTYRMQIILGAFEIKLTHLKALKVHLQSLFYFLVIPSPVAVDLARAQKVRSAATSSTLSTIGLAVVTDRVIGLIGSIVIVILFAPAVWPSLNFELINIKSSIFIIMAIAVLGTAILYKVIGNQALKEQLLQFRGFCARHRLVFFKAILLSIIINILVGLSVCAFALAMGLTFSPLIIITGLAAALFGMLVPISVAGIGASEAFASGIFVLFDIDILDAAIIAFLAYGARVAGGVLGAFWEISDGLNQVMTRPRKESRRG